MSEEMERAYKALLYIFVALVAIAVSSTVGIIALMFVEDSLTQMQFFKEYWILIEANIGSIILARWIWEVMR